MVGTELLPWVFTTGWASGINAYLVVLILGIAEKVFHVSGVPDALGRTDVMIGAAVLFLLEMFADKIPYVDSFWDTAHTVIRPAVGATLGYLIGHESSSLEAAFGAATGGFSALAAHLVKAGTRAAVNTSPEPASNVIVSTAEDAPSREWCRWRSSTRGCRRPSLRSSWSPVRCSSSSCSSGSAACGSATTTGALATA